MFLGLPGLDPMIRRCLGLPDPDPDPLVRGMDPDPDPSLFSQGVEQTEILLAK